MVTCWWTDSKQETLTNNSNSGVSTEITNCAQFLGTPRLTAFRQAQGQRVESLVRFHGRAAAPKPDVTTLGLGGCQGNSARLTAACQAMWGWSSGFRPGPPTFAESDFLHFSTLRFWTIDVAEAVWGGFLPVPTWLSNNPKSKPMWLFGVEELRADTESHTTDTLLNPGETPLAI